MLDQAQFREPTAYENLVELYNSNTIAEDIGPQARRLLSCKVLRDFNEDKESSKHKIAKMDKAIEIVSLKKMPKNKPFINASNIKYPMVTTACINFAARAEFETVKNGEPLHYKLFGQDPDGFWERLAKRKKTYMNWQLMEQQPKWLNEKKQAFFMCSIVGTVFTKSYYDPLNRHPTCKLLKYDRVIVNDAVSDIDEEGVRINEITYCTPTKIKRYIKSGYFRDIEIEKQKMDAEDSKAIEHEIIEQHCWMDLDNDGTDEPWIVTIHKASQEILRIAAGFELDGISYDQSTGMVNAVKKEKIYTVYRFWHDPEQGFYGIGYGTWLADNNEAVNSLFNQLTDAGTLANYQGGFIGSDLRIRKQAYDDAPGTWRVVDSDGATLKESIMPFDYKEPSQVLFSLLTFLIDSVNKMTSVTDALTGTANTTDASPNVIGQMIQQGLKVYSSVIRFLMSSVGEEAQILDRLNQLHPDLESYIRVVNPAPQEYKEMMDPNGSGMIVDLLPGNVKIVPIIDLTRSTEAERTIKDQVMMQFAIQAEQSSPGTANMKGCLRRLYTNLEIAKPEELVMPDPDPNAPNLPLIKFQSELDKTSKDIQFKDREIRLKEKGQMLDAVERGHKMQEVSARCIKLLADAESKESGKNFEQYKLELQKLQMMLDAETKIAKNKVERADGNPGPHPNAEMLQAEAKRRGWMQ